MEGTAPRAVDGHTRPSGRGLSGDYEIDVGRLLCAGGAVGLASVEHGRDIEPASLWWREVAREFIVGRGRRLLVVARVRTLQRKVQSVVPGGDRAA